MDATIMQPNKSMHEDNVDALKEELRNLEARLKESGLSDSECKKHDEYKELVSRLQQAAMRQPKSKPVSKGKGKKKSIVFDLASPGVPTPNTHPDQASDSEDDVNHEEGLISVAFEEEGAHNSTHDVVIAVEIGMKKKQKRLARDSSSSEVNVATRKRLQRSTRISTRIEGVEDSKARQWQEHAQVNRIRASYRKHNQEKRDKKRNGDREFKNFQKQQACS